MRYAHTLLRKINNYGLKRLDFFFLTTSFIGLLSTPPLLDNKRLGLVKKRAVESQLFAHSRQLASHYLLQRSRQSYYCEELMGEKVTRSTMSIISKPPQFIFKLPFF